ncbi:helix-turn-helix transcriptional regulator [Roseobacter fucihabitans]|uniref:helix-turn-helix transcriptional regulator n=1 Tax=Roseobacter fucihabitans TaxID=1537242 RepID=UPI001CA300CE|nr:helix-turn-helix transcriptional regulator [Roseobacter litoralis]
MSNAIMTAALDGSSWDGVADALAAAVPGVRTHLFGHDTEDSAFLGMVSSGYAPEYLASFSDHYGNLNAWAPAFASMPVGTIADSREMCPEEKLIQTEFYNDWVLPQEDIVFGGGAVVAKTPTASFLIGGNIRRRDEDRLVKPWLDLVRQITPQLRSAWKINRELTDMRIAARIGCGAGLPTIILQMDGRLVMINDAAETMITSQPEVFEFCHGKFSFTHPKAQASLSRALSRDVSSLPRMQFEFTISPQLSCKSFRVLPRSDLIWPTLLGPRYDNPCIALIFTNNTRSATKAQRLVNTFGLTTAEVSVVLFLADGMSPRDIAERRSVSLSTVRNQIKSAAQKCNVSRQVEIAKVVALT